MGIKRGDLTLATSHEYDSSRSAKAAATFKRPTISNELWQIEFRAGQLIVPVTTGGSQYFSRPQ